MVEEQSNDAQSVGGWGTSATLSNLNRAAKSSVSASGGGLVSRGVGVEGGGPNADYKWCEMTLK